MWENIYATKNIDFHNYIINIHSFDPKPICDLNFHGIRPSFGHRGFWIWKNVLKLKWQGFKIRRTKLKPTHEEPPISLKNQNWYSKEEM
jgi:hypothetical protein